MPTGTRSSKRKSSPYLKKKRPTKDGSKKRRKIGIGKSKKVSRREISDSYSDDETLSSGSSVLCSSTDEDRRRSRSRTRKEKSTRRKKSNRRSKSREDAVHDRRGKRSKKRKETDAKKKRVRRRRRREPSVSSNSRSMSCSTCGSGDDSEREHDKTEKRVKRRGRSRRVLDDDRSSRRHRSRSRSSSRLDGGDGTYVSEKQGHDENNPRRLRSIIIYAKDYEEADTDLLERDVQKEEIIYDHDDYPSPKCNDSNEGDSRREVCPVETGHLEDQYHEMGGSKVSITNLCDQSVMEHDANTCAFVETKASVASPNDGSSAADLEAVLRQKALENLRKFKGRMPANAKKPMSTKRSYDGQVKELLSGPNADVESQKKDEEGSNGEVGGLKKSAAQSVETMPQDSEMVNSSEKKVGADKLAKQLHVVTTQSLPLLSKDAKGLIMDSVDHVIDKSETGASALIQCQESSMPMSVPAQNKETVESVLQPCHDTKMVTDVEKTGECNSLVSNSEGHILNATGKVDEGSQFQQKTMSVMRGGEMVQVSYKVYIPKHAPTLARRKLIR